MGFLICEKFTFVRSNLGGAFMRWVSERGYACSAAVSPDGAAMAKPAVGRRRGSPQLAADRVAVPAVGPRMALEVGAQRSRAGDLATAVIAQPASHALRYGSRRRGLGVESEHPVPPGGDEGLHRLCELPRNGYGAAHAALGQLDVRESHMNMVRGQRGQLARGGARPKVQRRRSAVQIGHLQ